MTIGTHKWITWACVALLASSWTLKARAWVVIVDSTADTSTACATSGTGSCTLRDAIHYANTNRNVGGDNRIEFAMGSGDQTITVNTALPALLAPQAPAASLTLDASTQPGYSANSPLRPLITLRIATMTGTGLAIAGATTIKGLAIGGFYNGIAINGNNNTVLGCHVGTDAIGTTAIANQTSVMVAGSNNRVGGLAAGQRNIISAAKNNGLEISSGGNNTIQGNYIGTDISGNAALGSNFDGIKIGGAGGNLIDSNLVSANNVGNPYNAGIAVGSNANTLTRNRIGSNAAGTAVVGAQGVGINVAFSNANNNRIGTSVSDGNLIVGSTGEAIMVQGNSKAAKATNNSIVGNTIGTSAATSTVLPNGYGITLSNTDATLIRSNTIAGSLNAGISVQGDSTNSLIQGNFIGTNANAAVLPNKYGIAFFGSAHSNKVGGIAAQDANVIANHVWWGVVLYSDGVYGTSMLGNSIYRNGQGGIAATAGANRAQTAPVLTALTANHITGTLDSAANETFRIEYFSAPRLPDGTADPAAGKTLIGVQNVSTDSAGHAALSYSATVPTTSMATVTATATRASTGDTSRYAMWMALSDKIVAKNSPIPINNPWVLLSTLLALAYLGLGGLRPKM